MERRGGAIIQKPLDVEDLLAWGAGELARKRPGKVAARPAFKVARGDDELLGRWVLPMGFPRISPMFSGLHAASGARGEPPQPDALVLEAAIGEIAKAEIAVAPELERALVFGLGFAGLDVRGALDAALGNLANLLLVHGALHSRPLIRLEPPEVRPKLAQNGKPGVWIRREVFE